MTFGKNLWENKSRGVTKESYNTAHVHGILLFKKQRAGSEFIKMTPSIASKSVGKTLENMGMDTHLKHK